MFKNFLEFWRTFAFSPYKRPIFSGLSLLFLLGLCGCLTAPPMPKVNLSEPGWTIRQGQAIWRPKREGPEIAGELLLATKPDGNAFAQFTKTPFPFAVAQLSPKEWQIEFPPQNRRYAAPSGHPPARIVWFQLIKAETGKPVTPPWSWNDSGGNWRLTNASSGESLEGYFTP